MKKLTKKSLLNAIHAPAWLVIVLAVMLILRIPSFFEPFSYGDEMIYINLGEAVRRGLVLYKDIHDNKPPLLYFMAAIAHNVFWFRIMLAFWSVATIIAFWRLTEILFPKRSLAQKLATIIFMVLSTTPLLEGQIANAENFMLLPTILAFVLLLQKKLSPAHTFAAGILFSIATLFKVPAAFDLLPIIFFWIIYSKIRIKNLKKIATQTIFLSLGFALPIIASIIWYYFQGAFNEYIVAAFLQNIGYLSSWKRSESSEPFFVKNAPLITRGLLVLTSISVLYLLRKKLTKTFIFSCIWLAFSLFAVTLSERPYPHYLLQTVPTASILVSILLTSNKIDQIVTIIPLFITSFIPVFYNYYSYSTANYYTRFVDYATGKDTKEEYFDRFDGNVNRNYKIAKFLSQSTGPRENVFIWGDSSALYALSKTLPPIRFVADYHINDFSSQQEVIEKIKANLPPFIIILPESQEFPSLEKLLSQRYLFSKFIDGASIWYKPPKDVIQNLN